MKFYEITCKCGGEWHTIPAETKEEAEELAEDMCTNE
jgi:hypothetical protein